MSLPVISQPDITSSQLSDNTNAAQQVTNYAQAIVTAIPAVYDTPDWYAPISADITNVQAHANKWVTDICPRVSTGVPLSIINFNMKFQDGSTHILNLLKQIEKQPDSVPTAEQQQTINKFLDGIQTAVSEQDSVVKGIYNTVADFSVTVNADQQLIAKDMDIISGKISDGASAISEMQSAIGESFLDSTLLGPCSVIVSIDMNITLKVTGLNVDPTIISSVYLQAILGNVLGNIQTAQKCVQTVVDTWAIMISKYSTVLSDLADAGSDQYAADLQELDFGVAKTQWQQLADFAAKLLPAN